MKIGSFATFMFIVRQTTCMMDLFDIPLCGKKKLWYRCFSLYFLGNKILHRTPSGLRRPGFLLMLPHFLFTCSIFCPFCHSFSSLLSEVTRCNEKINPWCCWCAISRVQIPNENAALLDILYKNHSACCSEKFTYCSDYLACCSE